MRCGLPASGTPPGEHEPLLVAANHASKSLLNLEPWALPAGLVRAAARYLPRPESACLPSTVSDDGENDRACSKAVVEFDSASVRGRAVRGRVLLGDAC